MKLLLDTHTFLWWDSEPDKISRSTLDLLENEENSLILSVVSIWEIQIKNQLGKLQINSALADLIQNQIQTNEVEIFPLTLLYVLNLSSLPMHRKDPFDRILIAQANTENAALVSNDSIFKRYPVQLVRT